MTRPKKSKIKAKGKKSGIYIKNKQETKPLHS